MNQLTLTAGAYRLVLTPDRGGSISRFDWGGVPVFRPTCGPSILDTACFPLVPFSNRIAFGRFYADANAIRLPPNFPGVEHPHAIHGFGWQARWKVTDAAVDSAVLRHDHSPSAWPWPYVAEQRFELTETGLRHFLSVINLGSTAMPAGLGLHPYFPLDDATFYHGLHSAEWIMAPDGVPLSRCEADAAQDWWNGQPVQTRCVDTVYEGRRGPLSIRWPDRGIKLLILPAAELGFTVVYTPPGTNFFCVEPVSHVTDALNLRRRGDGMRWLTPGGQLEVEVVYKVTSCPPLERGAGTSA